MDTLQMIALLVMIILMLLFVYYLFNKQKKLTTGIRDAQKYHVVDVSEIKNKGTVSEMAMSIWVYISDWKTADGYDRMIYYMGPDDLAHATTSAQTSNDKLPSGDQGINVNYGKAETILKDNTSTTQTMFILWLDENYSTLKLGISNNDNKNIFQEGLDEYVSINNFPIQKWVCVTFSIYQNVLDLYMNGKLVKSVIDDQPNLSMGESPLVSLGNPFYVITMEDQETVISNLTSGFIGYTSRLSYYNRALTPKEAYNIYKNGPGTSYLGDLIGDRGVNINFMNGENITKTFSL